MSYQPPTKPATQPVMPDAPLVRSTILRCSLALERELHTLSRANQNRVLLALHAQIADQLDTFTTNTAS